MVEPLILPAETPEHPLLDYDALVAEGRRYLERMTDERWTDFNAHEPGITILEACCYALTDLGYRVFHSIPDLLAQLPDARPAGGVLFSAAEILTSRAVTIEDLRRLVLDVPGVRNAWIEPVPRETQGGEPLILAGLHRVLVEPDGHHPGGSAGLERDVASRLHANRNLCEDFAEIKVLDSFNVRLDTEIEIDDLADGTAVLVDVCDALADEMSPTIPFARLGEALAKRPVESVFEGPAPSRGFIDAADLTAAKRRRAIHLSDMIRAIMAVPGVRAVREIRFKEASIGWALPVPELKAPELDIEHSTFLLFSSKTDGRQPNLAEVAAAFARRRAARPHYPTLSPAERNLPSSVGRYRDVGRYRPIQADLPAVFGVGAGTLAASTPPERRAASTQLRAYLALFDHLLASYFALLEHLPQLLGPGLEPDPGQGQGEPIRTYFAGSVPEIRPTTDAPSIYDPRLNPTELQELVEPKERAPEALRRRNRLLNHLLARFGEELGNDPLNTALVHTKERFLRELRDLSGGRGTGVNLMTTPGPAADTPLLRRLLLQLDLEPGERVLVVEHILLRPQPGHAGQDSPLTETAANDPYSLQLTMALPARLQSRESRIARLVRTTVPAHLAVYLRWLAPAEMKTAVEAYDAFLASRGSQRDARGRLIDLLGLGTTARPPDPSAAVEPPMLDGAGAVTVDG
jgi:hypothetical protein